MLRVMSAGSGARPIAIRPAARRNALLAAVAALGLAGCGASDEGVNDPFEPANRAVHQFNKAADAVFFKPASRGFGGAVPAPVRRSLANAGSNLDAPRVVANHLLQGDVESAVHGTFRFLVNTTLGLFGLFDPAQDFGLEERDTGFADTLATWGVVEGPYLELPLFGPSTVRDAFGNAVDIATNPAGRLFGDDAETVAGLTALPRVLNSRYEFAETFDSVLYDSADSYEQLRLYYLDSRRFELGGSSGAADAFDPYEDLYDGIYQEIPLNLPQFE